MLAYLKGNRAYARYFGRKTLRTSVLNLMELYYVLLREQGEEEADEAFLSFGNLRTDVTDSDLKEGMKFRLRRRAERSDVSYVDAVGYQISRRLGMKFLTGDEVFESLPNVEFVR